MPSGPLPSSRTSAGGAEPFSPPALFPRITLWKGNLVEPPALGGSPRTLVGSSGAPLDLFDAVDYLFGTYHRLYVVDLEGVRSRNPQFDYLQEISRGEEIWVDAGPRNSDEAMDVIVAGATRAVLSTQTLEGAREISRTLKLTPQVVLQIQLRNGKVASPDPALEGVEPLQLAHDARERGVEHVLLSPERGDVDWTLVSDVAKEGPTYVGGSFTQEQVADLRQAGGLGGVFSATEVLRAWTTSGS